MNIYNCWEEDIAITPGQMTETGGKYAIKSLLAAVQALKQNQIHGLITAPIHKKNVQSAEFNFTGHTPFLKNIFGVNEVGIYIFVSGYTFNILIRVSLHPLLLSIINEITLEPVSLKVRIGC